MTLEPNERPYRFSLTSETGTGLKGRRYRVCGIVFASSPEEAKSKINCTEKERETIEIFEHIYDVGRKVFVAGGLYF